MSDDHPVHLSKMGAGGKSRGRLYMKILSRSSVCNSDVAGATVQSMSTKAHLNSLREIEYSFWSDET
jgi:hypothetical protein